MTILKKLLILSTENILFNKLNQPITGFSHHQYHKTSNILHMEEIISY